MSDGFGPGGRDLSIMVPVHDCAGYLGVTLESLARPHLGQAHIEVLDDCSSDDPAAVVAALGGGRVGYHRHDRNVGMVANFNACIARAQRPWVHILHGDDFVLPGAHDELGRLLERHPASRVLFARSVTVDELGRWRGTSAVLGAGEDGALGYSTRQWGLNPVQFAGVVFQRAAAEEVGGFDPGLAHTADWDLWWRLARSCPAAYTNRCLGAYRETGGNHTSTLRRSADNLHQCVEQLARIVAADADVDADREMYWPLFEHAVHQARSFAGDGEAVRAHLRVLARFPRTVPRTRAILRVAVAHAAERLSPSGW
ncbi:MAG: glycosyltransferase family 2 protein [Acidimicrobiia bacterium]